MGVRRECALVGLRRLRFWPYAAVARKEVPDGGG